MIKLTKGDIVDIVAPSGFSNPEILVSAVTELNRWGLVARTYIDFSACHPYHSDDDVVRFEDLKRAIHAPDSKVIWCLRGGYGSARLLPYLKKMKKPNNKKLLIGYSDITALHLFVNEHFGWESAHAPTISTFSDKTFDKNCLEELKNVLFKKIKKLQFSLEPLNEKAVAQKGKIEGKMTGGNLAVVTSLVGTKFAMKAKNKIVMLEDVNEKGYRVDRMLTQLTMASQFNGVKAIVFGDYNFSTNNSDDHFVDYALTRFAEAIDIPVYRCQEFGHGNVNRVLMMNRSYSIANSILY